MSFSSRWFHDAVSALVYSLVHPHANSPDLQPPFNDLTQFILAQHARMPDYLRTPMQLATFALDAPRFHRQPPDRRARVISAWKNSPTGFKRDLLRYFESLAILAAYSRDDKQRRNASEITDITTPQVVLQPARELKSEILVVGSGPGGAITACLLAEAGRDVLLVEDGQFLPLDSCTPFSQEEMQQKYRNGGQTVALGKNKIAYVEGRCVGGGSEINSGLYHRTPAEILERWRSEFGVEGLTEADLQPHFEACEKDLSVSKMPGVAPVASQKLRDGAAGMGWQASEIPRWFRYEPVNGKPVGKRQSMTETFVPRFLRAGGHLLPRTRVSELRQEGNRWLVEARHEAVGQIRISADTLFLCAGAVQSPALLRRSGITSNIGNSLRVHPTVKIVAQFGEEVNAANMGVPVHQVKGFAPRLSFGCSISSPPHLALGLIDYPEVSQQTAQLWKYCVAYYAMITSEGQGTVRGIPGFRDPLVRYRLTEIDRRNLADGFYKLAEMLFASGAKTLYPGLTGGPKLNCTGCLKKLPEIVPDGLTNLMTIHLFSSCPMGEDKMKCAADSFGRLHGFSNLFLNDASLLCTAPGVNPQGSVMALARRNALHFLGR
jgi:choline dehydrogenase-like flavoprotein